MLKRAEQHSGAGEDRVLTQPPKCERHKKGYDARVIRLGAKGTTTLREDHKEDACEENEQAHHESRGYNEDAAHEL